MPEATATEVESVATVDGLPIIWRTKLRSLREGVDHQKQVGYNFDGGLVGIGWGVENLPSGTPLPQVLRAIVDRGWGEQAASTVRLFGEEAKVGDFIWTRDLQGRFRLGRITGDYYFDNSPEAQAVDTHQVRTAEWAPRPLGDLEVPGAIIRAFSGTSTSFSRMWNEGARRYTAWIWEKLHGREPPHLDFTPAEILLQLEPYDLEDLIYTWMQVDRGDAGRPRLSGAAEGAPDRHARIRVDDAPPRYAHPGDRAG